MRNDTVNKHQSEPNGFSFSRSFRFDSIRFDLIYSMAFPFGAYVQQLGQTENNTNNLTKNNHKYRLSDNSIPSVLGQNK